MRIEWSPDAVTLASRFLDDTVGMVELVAAIDALALDPYPAEAFRWGSVWRLRAGPYRVLYEVDEDVITIDRVDRVL